MYLIFALFLFVWQAYRTIGREEGIRGLWKGAVPNIFRNSIVNVAEIVCYDIVKDCFMKYLLMKDNIQCHFSSAVVAGLSFKGLTVSTILRYST